MRYKRRYEEVQGGIQEGYEEVQGGMRRLSDREVQREASFKKKRDRMPTRRVCFPSEQENIGRKQANKVGFHCLYAYTNNSKNNV